MKDKGITAAELADFIGVQRSNVSHILNGRNKPGASFIEKLLIHYPELNARWLFIGTEGMYTSGKQAGTGDLFASTKNQGQEAPNEKKAKETPPSEVNEEVKGVYNKPESKDGSVREPDKLIITYSDKTFEMFSHK